MIQEGTKLVSADNTGATDLRCIKVIGGYKKRYAKLGDTIVVSIRAAEPRSIVKQGEVVRAVIVRQKKELRRKDGSYIRFDENAVVVLGEGGEPRGTRVFGPIAREVRQAGFQKIISLAPEVL